MANLPVLSLKALMRDDLHERSMLFEACTSLGIFYLDFESSDLGAGWESVRPLFAAGEEFFRRPQHEKEAISWDRTGTYFGYKARGVCVVDADGTPDSNEFLNISKDDALHRTCGEVRKSGLIDKRAAKEVHTFVTVVHEALLVILGSLSDTLEINEKDKLTHMHRIDQRSGDHFRFLRYAADSTQGTENNVMLIPHTDFGTLTLIVTNNPGLQVHDPKSNDWLDIEPRPNLAIVNVGDGLVKFTNGLLRACHHRVVASEQAAAKYSLGYFLRPEDEITLRTIASPAIPQPEHPEEQILSKDWTAQRVSASKAVSYKRERDWAKLRGTALAWDKSRGLLRDASVH